MDLVLFCLHDSRVSQGHDTFSMKDSSTLTVLLLTDVPMVSFPRLEFDMREKQWLSLQGKLVPRARVGRIFGAKRGFAPAPPQLRGGCSSIS